MWAWLKRLIADLIRLLSRTPPAPPPPPPPTPPPVRSPGGMTASKLFWSDNG